MYNNTCKVDKTKKGSNNMTTKELMEKFKGDNNSRKFDKVLRKSIEKYFDEYLPQYDKRSIQIKKFPIKEYWYLSKVMAKETKSEKYACWTCYNLTTESMNFGRYNLTKKEALEILNK